MTEIVILKNTRLKTGSPRYISCAVQTWIVMEIQILSGQRSTLVKFPGGKTMEWRNSQSTLLQIVLMALLHHFRETWIMTVTWI